MMHPTSVDDGIHPNMPKSAVTFFSKAMKLKLSRLAFV